MNNNKSIIIRDNNNNKIVNKIMGISRYNYC